MEETLSKERIIAEEASVDRTTFGFWVYLMTDLIMFAGLFAAFAVLRFNTAGGPASYELFDLPFALKETLILLTSSFICGLSMLAAHNGKKILTMIGFGATFALGASFLYLELSEFSRFVAQGASWTRSGFLSSYFALVGTHGLHITFGMLWILIMIIYISVRGLTPSAVSKLTRVSLFWHFLDLVWIFIFTIVYLMGVGL